MNNAKRMQQSNSCSWNRFAGVAAGVATGAVLALGSASALAGDWKEDAISPVTAPVYFEDPQINSEVRPIFAYHNIHGGFIGGDAQLYAAQLRWAVTDRLAIIAVKDGYLDLNPNVAALKRSGWADIAAGVKYAVIDDKDAQFIVTPGLTIELPAGQTRVLQGNGDGLWNLFVSAGKGFDKLRFVGNVGATVPNNFAQETSSLHYSLQVDYTLHKYFTPLATVTGFTVLSETSKGPAFGVEGFDLFNFGSSNAEGVTEVVAGIGFRSRLAPCFDVGFAWETPLTDEKGLWGSRYTVDVIWRW
jgi:hypothetical protein